jgi:site-specific recombinase XerD
MVVDLRVSELVGLKNIRFVFDEGFIKITGKGINSDLFQGFSSQNTFSFTRITFELILM